MKRLATACLMLALIPAATVMAKDKSKAGAPLPAVFQAVIDCLTVADSAQRLTCFDRTVREMATATNAKDLVILDREAMRETRKGLFGLSLPSIRLFASNGDGEKDEVKEIESTIAELHGGSDGFPVFVLEGGAQWKQTDGRHLFPKVGDKIRIKRAALGSYMAIVGNQPGVRVVRLPN